MKSRSNELLDKSIAAMISAIEIYNKGELYWQNLIDRATEQRVLDSRDLELLESAKKSCTTAKIVSNKQAAIIKKVVDSLKEVGIE